MEGPDFWEDVICKVRALRRPSLLSVGWFAPSRRETRQKHLAALRNAAPTWRGRELFLQGCRRGLGLLRPVNIWQEGPRDQRVFLHTDRLENAKPKLVLIGDFIVRIDVATFGDFGKLYCVTIKKITFIIRASIVAHKNSSLPAMGMVLVGINIDSLASRTFLLHPTPAGIDQVWTVTGSLCPFTHPIGENRPRNEPHPQACHDE